VEGGKDKQFSEFSRMLHTTSVRNCDNSSDKLTVTETETENQSAQDFVSPLKTPTLEINEEIMIS